DRSKIASVALTHAGGPRVLLARRGESFWLEAPVSDRADRDLVDRLLSALQGLAAKKFLEGPAADPATTGLANPSATLEVVVSGEATPFKLEFGKPESEGSLSHYARVGTEIVTTDADLAADLERAPEAWRSLSWAGMATWEVDRFEVSDAKGKLSLERAEGDWKRDGTSIPYSPVGDLLAAVTEIKGDKLVDAAPAGSARITLKLVGKEGHEETLTLLAPAAGQVAAKSSERTAALQVPEAKLTDLEAKIAAVRAAQPLPKPEPKPGEAKVETEEGK
nr:DUF4340 domain-containing protein [Thermoanaerobaculia bacterium]